ncbi:hypothetical protein AB7942_23620 [Neobacillus sp. BF23-41]
MCKNHKKSNENRNGKNTFTPLGPNIAYTYQGCLRRTGEKTAIVSKPIAKKHHSKIKVRSGGYL